MCPDLCCDYYFIFEASFPFNCRNQEGMWVSSVLSCSISAFPFSRVVYFWIHQDDTAEGSSSPERTCSMRQILQYCLSGHRRPEGQQMLANGSFATLCGIGQQLLCGPSSARNRFPELSQHGWPLPSWPYWESYTTVSAWIF